MNQFLITLLFATSMSAQEPADPAVEFNEVYSTFQDLRGQSRHNEAIPYAEQALELAEELLADDPDQIAMMTFLVGEVKYHGYDVEGSIPVLELAIDRYQTAFGERDVLVTQPMFMLARALNHGGKKSELRRAERLLQDALEIQEDAYGKQDPRLSEALRILAYNALRDNEGGRAENYTRRAVRLTEGAGPDYVEEHIFNLFEHGRVAMARRANRKAVERLLRARQTLVDSGLTGSAFRQAIEAQLVEAYERSGESDKATAHIQYLARVAPDVDTRAPVPLFRGIQKYPFSAQEKCRDGEVLVEFSIAADGTVRDPRIIEAKPRGTFDNAALEAVERYRYKPQIVDGSFVESSGHTVRLIWSMESARRTGACQGR